MLEAQPLHILTPPRALAPPSPGSGDASFWPEHLPLSGAVIDQAADVGETTLRSLDAIHLPSALSIQAELTAFVAYDHRLAEAASTAGLERTTAQGDQIEVEQVHDFTRCALTHDAIADPVFELLYESNRVTRDATERSLVIRRSARAGCRPRWRRAAPVSAG